ncbi:MAG: cytosolic protein [Desulfobacteraceae bacterium]|nr:MAG: cytosolic protein [Desulfobacteraceae bacterium]
MADSDLRIEDLDHENTARLLMDFFHRILIHYTLWFTEVRDEMGMEKALEVLKSASFRSIEIQMKRLSNPLGFEMKDQIPKPLLELPKEKLLALMDAVAVNWLANDGVWFQVVEFSSGMTEAKRCNDNCWAHFSPFEAWSIRNFLALPESPGLEGLKTALNFRIYSRVNRYSFIHEGPNGFVFQMNDCRVQSARKRKGMADYPCKSGGMIEYTSFAKSIDPAIRTECIGCPPDEHTEEWYCAWRFTI